VILFWLRLRSIIQHRERKDTRIHILNNYAEYITKWYGYIIYILYAYLYVIEKSQSNVLKTYMH
jgi:cytochrome oxidase assembly protein ShyY1